MAPFDMQLLLQHVNRAAHAERVYRGGLSSSYRKAESATEAAADKIPWFEQNIADTREAIKVQPLLGDQLKFLKDIDGHTKANVVGGRGDVGGWNYLPGAQIGDSEAENKVFSEIHAMYPHMSRQSYNLFREIAEKDESSKAKLDDLIAYVKQLNHLAGEGAEQAVNDLAKGTGHDVTETDITEFKNLVNGEIMQVIKLLKTPFMQEYTQLYSHDILHSPELTEQLKPVWGWWAEVWHPVETMANDVFQAFQTSMHDTGEWIGEHPGLATAAGLGATAAIGAGAYGVNRYMTRNDPPKRKSY